jgi:replicative DNA helicase
MSTIQKIASLDLEKQLVAGLIQYPDVYTDFGHFLNERDFTSDVLRTIFCVIRKYVSESKTLDKIIVGQDIKNSAISFEDNIDIFDFLNALSLIQIKKETIVDLAKELKKYTIARQLDENARKVQKEIRSNISNTVQEIINEVDKINNHDIDLFYVEDKPIDIYDRIEDYILEKGKNPVEETGLKTPHEMFNQYFGGLKTKNVYCFASRAGAGKSTFLTDLSRKTQLLNPNEKVKVLYLDTEMPTEDEMIRFAAAISGVPYWYLDTGNFAKNEDLYKKVTETLKDLKKHRGTFHHKYVANKPVEEIISIIKRWYYKECGRGHPCIVVYDYLKLTGERISNDWKEYQAVGEKVNLLKECMSFVNGVLLTAIQINRGGVTTNKRDVTDDESVISISDRVSWFATYLGIFRRKILEEIAEEGSEYGTHKLITLKARYQGRDSQGHHDFIRVEQEGRVRYKLNCLFYNVDNFNVTECGDLRRLVSLRTQGLDIIGEEEEEGTLL